MDKVDENVLKHVAWANFNMKKWESDVEMIRLYINSTPEEQRHIKISKLQQKILEAYDETMLLNCIAPG